MTVLLSLSLSLSLFLQHLIGEIFWVPILHRLQMLAVERQFPFILENFVAYRDQPHLFILGDFA